MIWYEE